jgi:hypothetical protein
MNGLDDILNVLATHHKAILQQLKTATSTKQKSNFIKQISLLNAISLQIIKLSDLSTADVSEKNKTNLDANW